MTTKSTVLTCPCGTCPRPVYLDWPLEPGQVPQCESCWEREGADAADTGEYATAY